MGFNTELNIEILKMSFNIQRTTLSEYSSAILQYNPSLFITPQWMEAVTTKNKKVLYLNIFYNNELIGKIAGLMFRNLTFNKELYFYSEPALKSNYSELLSQCLQSLVHYAKSHRFTRVSFGYLDQQSSEIPIVDGLKIKKTHEFVLQLQNEYKNFIPGNNFNIKLKKAAKINPEFSSSRDPEMVIRMISLLKETHSIRKNKNRHDYDLLSYNFVTERSLCKLVESGAAVFYYTKIKDQIHFISLCLEIDNRAYELYNGANAFGYANGLTGWMIKMRVEKYSQLGFYYFNLGGIPHEHGDKENLSGFKLQAGSTPKQVYLAQSEFLCLPEKLINPFFNLGKYMPYNRFTRFLIKALG